MKRMLHWKVSVQHVACNVVQTLILFVHVDSDRHKIRVIVRLAVADMARAVPNTFGNI